MLHPDYQLHLAEIDHQRRIAAARRFQQLRAGAPRTDAWWTRTIRSDSAAAAANADTAALASRISSAPATECR